MRIDIDDDLIVAAVVGAIGWEIAKNLGGSMGRSEFTRYLRKHVKPVEPEIVGDAGCNECGYEFNSFDGIIGKCPKCGGDNITLCNI